MAMRKRNIPMTYKQSTAAAPATITVRRRAGEPTQGVLTFDGHAIPVALGRGGLKANKREGDGGTPIGTFHPLRLWWRKDRHARPKTALPVRAIQHHDGWCEDPSSRRYNRPVRLAADSNADRLKRADHLYDFIVEIDHNTRPRIAGRGSAVFLHLARPGFAPTAGCIAMTRASMLRLLARLTRRTRIVVG
jgi:L,D-peptidoglycan transpeptidase YkuD (ErfK/YbiS/YcfS/YnhG family)